jgi:YHS domain-containing protein
MKRDVVCGKQVDETKAPATSQFKGEKYLFCGQECKDKFDKNPESYAASQSRVKEPTGSVQR